MLATAHVAPGRATVLVVASWCTEEVKAAVHVDWAAIGLDPNKSSITQPSIPGLQAEGWLGPNPALMVPSGQGIVLTIAED